MPRPEPVGPVIVTVTGMHRSGTSLAARAVNLLGVSFGRSDALMRPGADNPAGYWENRFVKELDDEVLAALGGSWDQPPVLAPGWELDPALDELVERAAATMERDLLDGAPDPAGAGPSHVGFKEPRLSLLYPFWQRVVALDASIVVVRHPREVAAFLAARNGLAPAESSTLWLRYVLTALAQAPRPIVVRHHDLVADPGAVVGRIAAHLGLDPPVAEVSRLVDDHLDPGLVHHRADDVDVGDLDDPVLALAELVWNDGDPDAATLPAPLVDALVAGWFGPPGNRAQLAAARAEAVDLRERLRRRLREVRTTEP